MRWLALHLPLLSLEAFCTTLPAGEAALPVALVSKHRVHSVNAAAAACGVRPGMKRATALALAAEMRLAEASVPREAAALRAVVHAALAFTPSVTLQDNQTVLLEVQGSLRLFGGAAALHQGLAAALAPLGHRVQVAAAPTAVGAALLARWFPVERGGADRSGADVLVLGPHATDLAALQALLDGAPVVLLSAPRAGRARSAPRGGSDEVAEPPSLESPSQEHGEALQAMGLHTLADLRELPRAGLARRFGTEVLDELDRALGRRADPRRWLALPAAFDSRLELFARAETTEQVLHGAGVLLARLLAWAQARRARVGSFTLRMCHERHARQRQAMPVVTELVVALAEPSLDMAHLQLLLRERLARMTLAAPTLELQLACRHLVAGAAPHGELFPTRASHAEGLAQLLERLRARLGDDQVQRLVPVADHRPERASHSVPAQGTAAAAGAEAAAALAATALAHSPLPLHRPAWLLPVPQPLAERDTLPLLQGRPLQLLSGPERIETGWWDGEPSTRDYFIAQAEDGSLVWVWRGRLPVAPGEAHWFLQGRFA